MHHVFAGSHTQYTPFGAPGIIAVLAPGRHTRVCVVLENDLVVGWASERCMSLGCEVGRVSDACMSTQVAEALWYTRLVSS